MLQLLLNQSEIYDMPNIFSNLDFDKFKDLATDHRLSRHEKVGFPNEYREGKEEIIFRDICSKISQLQGERNTILEIGPGCSNLPILLADLCKQKNSNIIFVDSSEMLALLPDLNHIEKVSGYYPDLPNFFEEYAGKIDAILVYSVIQYVFTAGNLWNFLDRSLSLLSEGGEMLIGDIPNISMRKRFFSSSSGVQSHRNYTGKEDDFPDVKFNQIEYGQMDDSVVFAILSRARSQGFHSWVIPQTAGLPMANRREDILIKRP